jgi:hypothetical protein
VFVSGTEPPNPLVFRTGRPPAAESTAFERSCPRHGPSTFHRYADGRVRCTRCVGEAVTRRHQRVKRYLVAEAGGCCAVCGYDRTVINLHFHHVDPATKSFNITMGRGKSLAAYRDEARKCVLVCANCHGEIEAGLIASPPPGATFAARSLAAGPAP